MSTITLPAVFSNACTVLDGVIPVLLRDDYPLPLAERAWKSYRLRGIVQLFLTGSAAGLFDNLQKSALLGAHHLAARGAHGLALSRFGPVLDAMACGADGLVQRLAQLTAEAQPIPDLEYVDDYWYLRYLLERWSDDTVSALLALSNLRTIDDGAGGSQMRVCQAFEAGDAEALDDALAIRLDEHESYYEALLEGGAVTEEDWVSEGQLSVEGLVLVRLALRLGLAVDSNYKFVPSLVIRTGAHGRQTLPPDAWQRP